MRRVLRCLCGVVLLASMCGVAHGAVGSSMPADGKIYVVRGVIAQFIRPAGTSVGSVSVRVVHSSRSQHALRGMLLTLGIDDHTHIVGSIRTDATCSVRVRAKTADDLPSSTALEVVVDSRDRSHAASRSKDHKTPPSANADKPAKPATAGAAATDDTSKSKPADAPAHTTPSGSHSSGTKSDGKGHG